MKRATLAAVTLATATLAYGAAYVVGTSWNGSIVLPHDESGAGPLREVADSAARGWADGPTLVRVATTEGAPLDGRVDPPFAYDTSTDPHVGDGRALVWTFSYTAPSKGGEVFHASVGGDGSLLYARSLPDATWGCCIAYMHVATASSTGDDGSYDPAIAPRKAPLPIAFRIDAPEAYERVLGRAEFDGFAIDHPVFLATTELLSDGRGAVWSLAYHTATGYSADAAVDADTGEVLSVSAWPSRDPPPPPCYDCCGACPGSWPPQDFEGEWSGHDADDKRSLLLGKPCNFSSTACAGPTTHAGGDEDHVGALEGLHEVFLALIGGLPADLGIASGAEPLGDLAADVDLLVGVAHRQGLRVGVDGDELDPAQSCADHAVDGIAAAAPHADHLDRRVAAEIPITMRHGRCPLCCSDACPFELLRPVPTRPTPSPASSPASVPTDRCHW